MRRIIILISGSLLLLNFMVVKGVTIDTNWEKIDVPQIGSIEYPNAKLEIQGESMRMLREILVKPTYPTLTPTKITLQQLGVNEGKNLDKYCRVIFQENRGNKGDFLPRNLKFSDITESEKSQIIQRYKNSMVATKVKEWKSTEILIIKGDICIKLEYIRASAIENKPDVYVQLFSFPQSSREVDLYLSCRINELDFWVNDFEKIKNSIVLL